jgi:hypothetical protein
MVELETEARAAALYAARAPHPIIRVLRRHVRALPASPPGGTHGF